MKLSSEQIEKLYQFTRQHYVEYYDLQTELVDHLANSIENQWQQYPELSFDEALQFEFKKFGVFGFMNVVESRQNAMNKKYNKIVWKHFKEFFTIPKVILTISAFLVLIQIMLRFPFAKVVLISLLFLNIIFLLTSLFITSRKNKKQIKQSGKKWLFKDIISNYGTFSIICYLPFNITYRLIEDFQFHLISSIIISSVVISFGLITYIISVIIPYKAEEYLQQTYPEYSFS